jgi:hypothetical protein
MMVGGRLGSDLLDDILSEAAAFTESATHQDDVTLLTLDLAND